MGKEKNVGDIFNSWSVACRLSRFVDLARKTTSQSRRENGWVPSHADDRDTGQHAPFLLREVLARETNACPDSHS